MRSESVLNGGVEIKAPEQETADRTADKLNKADDRAETYACRADGDRGGGGRESCDCARRSPGGGAVD